MSKESLIHLLNTKRINNFLNYDQLNQVFLEIIDEAVRSFSAKNAVLFLIDEFGGFNPITNFSYSTQAQKIAKLSVFKKKDYLIRKYSLIESIAEKANDTYISCFIGDENSAVGVFLLEGIKHFESFSYKDFELVSLFSKSLTKLFKNSEVIQETGEVFLHFKSAIQLLIESSDNNQKNTRLEFLLKEVIRVSGLINSSLDLNNLLKDVMESVKSVFRTESCSILLVDKEKQELYFHIVAGEKAEELSKIRVPIGKGIAGTVAITRVPMIINDAQNDNRVYKDADKASDFITRNILATPLIADNEVIGVMEGINTIDRNNFDDSDIELFLSFSDAAAVAIQKTRLLNNLEKTNLELEKKVSELASLFDLGKAVLESGGSDDLIFKSLEIISKALDVSKTVVYILEPKTSKVYHWSLLDKIQNKSEDSYIQDSVIINAMIESKIKMEIDSFFIEDDFDLKFLKGSFIIIPLIGNNNKPFGGISISGKKDRSNYLNNDLKLLQTISSQFIKGYENITLNSERIQRQAMQKELDITRNIQQNILPNHKLKGSNFDLGVKSEPAKDVSGDFYDYFKYDDGQFSFLIADVSGKSLPAAIFMAMSSSVMRTLSRNHETTPANILKSANALVYEDSQSGMFVTLFYIHYNPSLMEVEYASAGHNDQIWIKEDGSYEILKGQGAPLGVMPNTKYVGGKLNVKIGDMIVLYTDGAVEEKNPADEEYGLDRFVEEIQKRKDKPSQQIIEEIYQDIMEFSQATEQFDDFTVLILKFNEDFQFRKTFPATNDSIPIFRDFLENTISMRKLDEFVLEDILLCCDEAATNIVMHSYKDTNLKNPSFDTNIKFIENRVIIQLVDKGKDFDRKKVPAPSLEANMKGERKGGFGVYLVEKLMDKVEYLREGDYNIINIEKIFQKNSS